MGFGAVTLAPVVVRLLRADTPLVRQGHLSPEATSWALWIGLGVSVVAGVIYTLGWEISLAATHYEFADSYGAAMIAAARAHGASPARLAEVAASMQAFKAQYANPLYRLPMTFAEIFPVGVVISLVSAALLRNSRFLPARG